MSKKTKTPIHNVVVLSDFHFGPLASQDCPDSIYTKEELTALWTAYWKEKFAELKVLDIGDIMVEI